MFVGLCGIFYMLEGGTNRTETAQHMECAELNVLPDAQVDDLAESRIDAYNQAVLLLDQEEKERELQAEHNSFHFFAEEVEEKEFASVHETEVDEKNQSALEAFQEIAGVQVGENKKKSATGTYTQYANAKSSVRQKKKKTEEPEIKELSLEDLEAAKEAEKKEKLERLKELYNQGGHVQKKEVEEKDGEKIEDVPVKPKNEQPVNGFKPIGGGAMCEKKGTVNAVIHGEQRDITSSSQVVLRLHKYRKQGYLPGISHTDYYRICKICIQSHTRCKRKRIIRKQCHTHSSDKCCQSRRNQHCICIHSRCRQNTGIDSQNICHCHECCNTCNNFCFNIRIILF